MIDRSEFPSDTVSTHMIFPNTVARLDELGVLETLSSQHELSFLEYRVRILGHEVGGAFTPVRGYDKCFAPRRIALDKAMTDTAIAAGVETRFDTKVASLLGAGVDGDPVRGVVLEDGEEIEARWVFGADGRASTVANSLGLEKEKTEEGEFSFLFGYWRGIPNTGYCLMQTELYGAALRYAIEDGLTILTACGDADFAKGSAEERLEKYRAELTRYPELIDAELLAGAELVSGVVVAPETLLRGFYRQASGPGWALVGDSGHFKHPATAQGIGDAVEQAFWIAEALAGEDPTLDDYGPWRDKRSAEHYPWSYSWGRFPTKETTEPVFRGIAEDPEVNQLFTDTFSRQVEPSEVLTPERLQKWFTPA
jgi:flavin-dependent dehydrogenase